MPAASSEALLILLPDAILPRAILDKLFAAFCIAPAFTAEMFVFIEVIKKFHIYPQLLTTGGHRI